jgi:hypothetical protein
MTKVGRVLRTLILVALIGGAGAGLGRAVSHPMQPCYEDEVLVGQGDFSHGYWTDYVCEPIDNLT